MDLNAVWGGGSAGSEEDEYIVGIRDCPTARGIGARKSNLSLFYVHRLMSTSKSWFTFNRACIFIKITEIFSHNDHFSFSFGNSY